MNLGFLSVVLPIAVVAAMIVLLSRGQRQKQVQREADWRTESAARGWAFDTDTEGEFQRMRWQGQTDGVAWTLEFRRGRHKHRGTADRAHRVRWWANAFQGPSSPVLCIGMNKGQEQPALKLAQGEGMLATLAQKAAGAALDKTLDVYFGEEAGRQVDARLLKPVENTPQAGYLVMSADAAVAARWMAEGSGVALDKLVADAHSALHTDIGRPWVLWIGRQVMLANMRPVNGMEDVTRLVNAGVALTNV
jgi:hypothetical protein